MPIGMEYRFIEDALARLHGVPNDGRSAFRSRLRVLRDAGVPSVKKVGKGARVDYSFSDAFEMHLGLHLEHFGYPPAHVKFVVGSSRKLLVTFKQLSGELLEDGKYGDVWMLISFQRQKEGILHSEGNVRVSLDLIEDMMAGLKETEKLSGQFSFRSDC